MVLKYPVCLARWNLGEIRTRSRMTKFFVQKNLWADVVVRELSC